MAMKNIEMFNRLNACLFAELYENFPKPIIHLSVVSFCEKYECIDAQDIFKATMDFLAYEGLIRYKDSTNTYSGFSQVILTLKGFGILNKVPDSLKPQESVGEVVVEKLKSGAFNIASDVIQNALLGMIR